MKHVIFHASYKALSFACVHKMLLNLTSDLAIWMNAYVCIHVVIKRVGL